mgnify:CR=1 FL=1
MQHKQYHFIIEKKRYILHHILSNLIKNVEYSAV